MKGRFSLLVTLIMAACLMAGCASLRSPAPSLVEQGILAHYQQVQQWPPEQLEVQLPIMESAYVSHPIDENRMRLAVTLAFGQCGKCDSGRALKLFAETVEVTASESVAILAALFSDLLELKADINTKSEQLFIEQQRIDELQQKLDALTSIEKSLHQRD